MASGTWASLPAPAARSCSSANSAALRLRPSSEVFELRTSTASISPRSARSRSAVSSRLRRIGSNGCGMYTSPPWFRIASAASMCPVPAGILSVRKRPMTSPFGVRSSSPTTTRHGNTSRSASAPARALWSVMHSTSSPAASTAATNSSGVVVESPLHMVWLWRSTRTAPCRRSAARWGWRSIAERRDTGFSSRTW